jgi:hypothetical protein
MENLEKNLEIAKSIVKNSGNNFHYNVVEALRKDKWVVEVSPFYNDHFSQKPREIDLIAEKWFKPEGTNNAFVIVRFFIECKFILDPTVFWLDNRNKKRAEEVIRKSGNFHDPSNILVKEGHHYLSQTKIAKLFESNSKKTQDGELVYKAITQSLNSLIYYRKKKPHDYDEYASKYAVSVLDYPLIISNSFTNFFGKDTTTNSEIIQLIEPFQLEVRYAYFDQMLPREETFYIDILSLEMIDIFIKNIVDNDVELARQKASDDLRQRQENRQKTIQKPNPAR